MNKDWTWEPSPKKEFQRRRLERCWNLPNTKDTTYRNKGVGQKVIVNVETPVERIKPMKPPEPYWNFWRAVFAGWLIRYPGKIFKGIGMFFLFIVFMIFMAVSPDTVEETPSTQVENRGVTEYNQEVIQ